MCLFLSHVSSTFSNSTKTTTSETIMNQTKLQTKPPMSDTIVICLGEFGEWGEAKCGASGSARETMVLKNIRALLSPYSDLVARQDPT